jgi:hypothetical protein
MGWLALIMHRWIQAIVRGRHISCRPGLGLIGDRDQLSNSSNLRTKGVDVRAQWGAARKAHVIVRARGK